MSQRANVVTTSASIPRDLYREWKLRTPRFGDRSKILAALIRFYLSGKVRYFEGKIVEVAPRLVPVVKNSSLI